MFVCPSPNWLRPGLGLGFVLCLETTGCGKDQRELPGALADDVNDGGHHDVAPVGDGDTAPLDEAPSGPTHTEEEDVTEPVEDEPQEFPEAACRAWGPVSAGMYNASPSGMLAGQIAHGCWESRDELPEGIVQRTFEHDGDWVTVFSGAGGVFLAREGLAWDDESEQLSVALDGPDGRLVRLTSQGEVLWTRSLRSTVPGGGALTSVVSLADGGVIVGGEHASSSFSCDSGAGPIGLRGIVSRFSSAGEEVWSYLFDGLIRSMVTGTDGTVFLGGRFRGEVALSETLGLVPLPGSDDDGGNFVIALDVQTAEPKWAWSYGAAYDGAIVGTTPDAGLIVVDASVSGDVRKLTQEGEELWGQVQPDSWGGRPFVGQDGQIWLEYTNLTFEPGMRLFSDEATFMMKLDESGTQLGCDELFFDEPPRATVLGMADAGNSVRLVVSRVNENAELPPVFFYYEHTDGRLEILDEAAFTSSWNSRFRYLRESRGARLTFGGTTLRDTDFGFYPTLIPLAEGRDGPFPVAYVLSRQFPAPAF